MLKIDFRFSLEYDYILNKKAYLGDIEEIDRIIKNLNNFWNEYGQRFEKELEQLTGLSYKTKSIICYLNTGVTFSDPFSLRIESREDMENNLIHQLIHILIDQNFERLKSSWKAYHESFKSNHSSAITDSVIHSIHILVIEKIIPERVKNIRFYKDDHPLYQESWNIVDIFGPRDIIQSAVINASNRAQ